MIIIMTYYNYDRMTRRIHPEWMPFFEDNKYELVDILVKINEFAEKNTIYPHRQDIFRAFYYHSPKDIKLAIIAQDPYINEEKNKPQAMGLCFSVPKCHKLIPPSLQNIRKEIKNCYPDYDVPKHGLLKKWAKKEKMLLLNSVLTVNKGCSNSHAKIWTDFTDKLIKWFSTQNPHCIFLLMGGYAKDKRAFIDLKKHKIFTTVHPSPLSVHNGFFGSEVFKKIDEYLEEQNMGKINW
jgi:uracil-DNA glycosylase